MLQSRGVQSRQPTLKEAFENVVPEGDNLLRDAAALIAYLVGGAASLRGEYNREFADALRVATGVQTRVGYLITNDAQWNLKLKPISRGIRVCYMQDHLPRK